MLNRKIFCKSGPRSFDLVGPGVASPLCLKLLAEFTNRRRSCRRAGNARCVATTCSCDSAALLQQTLSCVAERAAADAADNADRVPRRSYILCWRQYSRRKLSPTLATPTTLVLTTLAAQCELSRRKIGLLLKVVGRKFSHRPGNPAAVGVVRWPAAGDTAGSSLRLLSSLQHRIYNLLENDT